jgi:hypothetical protein
MDALAVDAETYAMSPSDFARDPPPYPEGLHDAAKADRDGPFWSSLGEPDDSTGIRPAYLRRDDWHFSSTFSTDKRAEVDMAEHEFINTEGAILVDTEAEEDAFDPFAELEYMKLEKDVPDGLQPSKLKMPSSWQEYQFLQGQVTALVNAESLSSAERSAAGNHEHALMDYYSEFKAILNEGWRLENNPVVVAAVEFVMKHTKQ